MAKLAEKILNESENWQKGPVWIHSKYVFLLGISR